jgi:hypothetical protein
VDRGFGIGRSFLHTDPRYFTLKSIVVLFSTEPKWPKAG